MRLVAAQMTLAALLTLVLPHPHPPSSVHNFSAQRLPIEVASGYLPSPMLTCRPESLFSMFSRPRLFLRLRLPVLDRCRLVTFSLCRTDRKLPEAILKQSLIHLLLTLDFLYSKCYIIYTGQVAPLTMLWKTLIECQI